MAALALPSLASAQASADLVANNHGPTTAAAGEAFTYTVTLTNNGPWAADGATFTTTMPQNATNVGAVCAAATPGAGCPAALTVSNTAVGGVIPRFPDQGKVLITITGHYGVPSPTSVTSTVTITPPPGVDETEPATNSSTVNTNLITDAKLIATKTRTGDGDAVTYTITLKNEGNAAAHGARIRDFLEASVHLADAPTQASVNASFVSCTASVGALCPDDEKFGGFTGIKGNGSRTLFDTVIPQLSAGSSVTVVYRAVITPAATCGLSAADLVNTAEITPPDGITNQVGTPRASARLSMPGTAACPPTPTWPFELSKTHDLVGDMLNWNQELIYTVTIVNTSDQAADNTRLYDWLSSSSSSSWVAAADVTSELLDCTAENGARCPADSAFVKLNKQRLGDSKTLFDIRIPVFPPNGKITIRYKVRLDQATQPCGKSWSYLNNFVRAEPPLAGHNSTRLGPSRVKTPGTDACRYASTELLKTESKSIVQMADGSQRQAIDFKVSVKGLGPEPADGAAWTDYLSVGTGFAADLKARGVFVSCAATDGAECPSRDRFIEWEEPVQLNAIRSLFKTGTTIPKLPVGGRIELIYRLILEPLEAGNCKSASGYIENNTRVWAPAPWAGESFKYSRAHLACADLGVSLSVDPIELHAGEELTYTVVVSNSGLSAVNGAVLEDKLPAIFEFESASCEVIKESVPAYPATACGDLIAYDAATHTLRSTIRTIGMLGEVSFKIKGRAGNVPGTYKNEARVTMPAGVVDPRLVSNYTDVNVQIANTQSPLTVKKVVAGLPVAGLPEALTFTGEVSCGIQPPQPWSITVPAGALEASMDPALSFYDGEQCTVSEDTPPAPPAGYAWDGAPSIGNSTDPLGPSTAREVTVVNTLQRLSAGVELSKRFSGPAEAVEKVDGTFSFELDCGADGQYQQDVVVAGGAAASVTVSDLPAGASCQITETATPEAPAGFKWGLVSYSSNPVTVPVAEGAEVSFMVTNTLQPTAARLVLNKAFSGPADVVQQVEGTFHFAVDCGAGGLFNADVPVSGGTGSSVALDGLPLGAQCEVRETMLPAAPAGFEWGPVSYDSNPVTLPDAVGGEVSFRAINALKPADSGTPDPALARVLLIKNVSGPADVVQQVNGTFRFALNCDAAGMFDAAVAVSGGESSSATVYGLPLGARCVVSEITPPSALAPEGFAWDTPIYASNPVIVPDAEGRMVSFAVTNMLKPSGGGMPDPDSVHLLLNKAFSGPADAVQQVNGLFGFELDCGVGDLFSAEVSVKDGESSEAKVSGLPLGAQCAVRETTLPAAPKGFDWGPVSYDSNPVALPTTVGGEVRFRATNQLARADGSTPHPVPPGLVLSKQFDAPDSALQQVNGTFRFVVDCGAGGVFNADVPVSGGKSGSVTLGSMPAGAQCKVRETDLPPAPAGFIWGPVGYDSNPVSIPDTGDRMVRFSVTNTLYPAGGGMPAPELARLLLNKAFNGPSDAVQRVDGIFRFAVDCGASGLFNADVPVSGGTGSSAALDGLPLGAQCEVRETMLPPAPAGFEWGPVSYDSNPVTLPSTAGGEVSFRVTNTLRLVGVTAIPVLGLPWLVLLAGLLGGLGAFYRRSGRAI